MNSSWQPFENGKTIGLTGSENGVIILDEEVNGARITIERLGFPPYSITCGIYGWMFHTRFFSSETEARNELEDMKAALSQIVNHIPNEDDPEADIKEHIVIQMMHDFVERFP